MAPFSRAVLWLTAALCAHARHVSISGQSAGGSMAVNHLFAFSESVDGAGIASGSPYGCGALPRRQERCYHGPADVAKAVAYAYMRQAEGQIDALTNLENTPVLLFNGKNDWEVYTQVMRDTRHQLDHFARGDDLIARFQTGASHVWSVNDGSCVCGACALFGASLTCCDINNCDYDLSGDILRHIYGATLQPPAVARAKLRVVDQWRYTLGGYAAMERWGFVYVPTRCAGSVASCRVHVHYHGCILRQQHRRLLWISLIGLNEYGEANDIVIVHPQAAGDANSGEGCWNWGFAESDPLFDTRSSAQIGAVVRLVEDLEVALAVGTNGSEPQLEGLLGNISVGEGPQVELQVL